MNHQLKGYQNKKGKFTKGQAVKSREQLYNYCYNCTLPGTTPFVAIALIEIDVNKV
jgi:hypothetical protein